MATKILVKGGQPTHVTVLDDVQLYLEPAEDGTVEVDDDVAEALMAHPAGVFLPLPTPKKGKGKAGSEASSGAQVGEPASPPAGDGAGEGSEAK